MLGFKLREYEEDHDGAIRNGMTNQKLSKERYISSGPNALYGVST